MNSHRILIVFATTYGQTAKVAGRLADLFALRGDVVTRLHVEDLREDIDPLAYDAVIVGASVIMGHHQRRVRDFVRANVATLDAMPSAFFSVSASAASPDERGRADARRCAESFLRGTHWRPAVTAMIGGALAYTKYGLLLRWVMKQIAKRNGAPTDTTRDYELTDWTQVEQFAQRFAAIINRRTQFSTDRTAVVTALASAE